MAKKKASSPDEPEAPSAGPEAIEVDDKQAAANYANFCRIMGTPEEAIFDFGLNLNPHADPPGTTKVSHRVVTNWYTAKRLLYAIGMSVQRHEAVFGALELDVQRRAQ
jgi:hypothetical protein